MIFVWILTLSIISGQLIKLPIINLGVTILDLTVLAFCCYGIFKIKFHLKKPPLFVKFSLPFIFICLISLILTPLNLNLIQELSSLAYIIRFTSFILFGWLIYSDAFLNFKENSQKVLIFSGIVLGVLGLLQLIFLPDLRFLSIQGWDPHFMRTVSTFFDPNFLGAYLVLTLLLLQKSSWGIILLVYIALLTTFSRGAYLTFGVSFLTLTILNRSIKLFLLTGMLSLGLFLGYSSYQKSVAVPRNIDRTKSAEYRLDSWQQGFLMFQKNPVLGVGYNAYRYGLEQYKLADQNFISSRGASSNDSSFLFVLATTGVLGLASYLTFLFSIMWIGRKNYILLAGLAGLIVQSFFANTLFYPFLLIWIVIISSTIKSHSGIDQKV